MATKEKTLVGYAFTVNAVQIILCFVIFFLRKFNAADFVVTQGILFAAEILIWFICGAAFALGLSIRKMKHGLLYSMIALLPIMLITAVCTLLGFVSDAGASGWAKYFFLGSAVNFWHRPAVIISVIIKNSAYLIFAINLAILFCASLTGVNYGILLNISKQRKPKKRIKKVTREKTEKTAAETAAETIPEMIVNEQTEPKKAAEAKQNTEEPNM